MAQWWHASSHYHAVHQDLASYSTLHNVKTLCTMAARSFLSNTLVWEDFIFGPCSDKPISPSRRLIITCFCDDDPHFPEHLFEKDSNMMSPRTKLEPRYSPWAISMMDGLGKRDKRMVKKEFTGGPTGGGNGRNDDGGEGGGGDGDEDGDEDIYILPLLTIAFAAFQLGYCVAVWMKDEKSDFKFFQIGIGLFLLLTLTAIRLNSQTGLDAYILGLGASLGVMLWTGERCLMRKGGSAGIVTLFSGIMVAIFTRALYENLLWKGW